MAKTATLHVNTRAITTTSVDANCNFGQGPGITNENYVLQVNVNDEVDWVGVADNNSDSVVITDVIYESKPGSVDVFASNNKPKKNGNKVEGKIASNSSGETESYTIKFTVSNIPNTTFQIDPKIYVNT